jgi:MFS family permease
MFRTLHYVKKRAVNPAHALALCYAGMVCLAIAVNLMPIFLTTVQVDLGGKAVLTHEQLGRISALAFAGLVGGILFTGPLADRWGGKLFSILGTLLIGVGPQPRWTPSQRGLSLVSDFHPFGSSIYEVRNHLTEAWDARGDQMRRSLE